VKKKIALSMLILFVGILFTTQVFSQIRKRDFIKRRANVRSQVALLVQGDMVLISDRSQIDARIVLKNNNINGTPVRSATVTINGTQIPETNEAGVYRGYVGIYIQPGSGCPINIKIVTTDKREITSSGNIDSLLKLHVSNRFPRQPAKIDVGETPITVRWEFVPPTRKAVDVVILNLNNNGIIYQQRGVSNTDRVVVPRGVIPKRQNIEIYVEAPVLVLPIQQNVHQNSYIKLHTKTALRLTTFG